LEQLFASIYARTAFTRRHIAIKIQEHNRAIYLQAPKVPPERVLEIQDDVVKRDLGEWLDELVASTGDD